MEQKPLLSIIGRLGLLGLLFFATPSHAQTVIYRETFGNSGTTNYLLSNTTYLATDWQVYYSASGTNGRLIRAVASNVASSPTNLDNVGTGYTTPSQTNGVLYTDQPTDPYFFFTTGHTGNLINVTQSPDLSFSWYQRNNSASDGFRVAVQVEGSWYVTSELFTSTASVWTLKSFAFANDAVDWCTLNFTAGTTMSVGNVLATDLSSSNITGFGLYSDVRGAGGSNRLDTFALSVPESRSAVLLLGSVACLLACQRVRRRANALV
ncbi:MAG: hypothetical protein B9S32_14855 [Verrucomicrobia bacterium Tous-C9LFEB]|nr:MAG: hypothetical protein B9S32_14855 [Verrucomicrobia bacterium Tous-C9LFEB]